MLDTLHLEIPFRMPYRADFKRVLDNPENVKILRRTGGGLYEYAYDLRGVNIPIRLSVGHRYHPNLGPKVEYLETGKMGYSDWVGNVEQVFKGDLAEASITRIDATADIQDVTVAEVGKVVWTKHKHTTQQEYGEFSHVTRTYNRFSAQTTYAGRGSHQIRIYDKTEERRQRLTYKIHRNERKYGLPLSTFEEAFGYPSDQVITRFERQMGAREPEKIWGIRYFGEIAKLLKCDPFDKLKFIGELEKNMSLGDMEAKQQMFIWMARNQIDVIGLDCFKAIARQFYTRSDPRAYRKFWADLEPHLAVDGGTINREAVTEEYRDGLRKQLGR